MAGGVGDVSDFIFSAAKDRMIGEYKMMTGWVVVPFGSGDCALSHCPMEAIGPFSFDEAKRFQALLPEWQQAHVLRLREAGTSRTDPPRQTPTAS
jgi:hypothetical protein